MFYEPAWLEDTAAVVEQLARRGVASRFLLGGLCSGAYWAWRTALRDDRVVALLLLNQWAFFYEPGLEEEREPGDAVTKVRQQGIIRLLRKGVTLRQLARVLRSIRPSRLIAGHRHPVEHRQLGEITGIA